MESEGNGSLPASDDRSCTGWVAPHRLPEVVATTAERDGWEPAQRLVERHWDRYVSSAPARLLEAIRALPGDAFIERPTMLVAANFLQHVLAGGKPGAFSHGEWLDAATDSGRTSLMDTLGLLTSKTASLRTEGRLIEAVRAAERARTALGAATAPERAGVRLSLPHYRIQWGRSFELGDAPGADREYEESYDLAMATEQPAVARRASAQFAWLLAVRGRLNSAETWLARSLALAPTGGRYEVVVYLTNALLKLDRGDVAGAGRELSRAQGLELGEYWSAALWVQAMQARGLAGAAIVESALFDEMHRRGKALTGSGAHGRYLRAAQARLSALRRPPGEDTSARDLSPADRVISSALAYAKGRYEKAVTVARSAAAASEPPRTRCAALLVIAAAERGLGRTRHAAEAFGQANALIDHERLYSAYECVPREELEHLASLAGVTLPATAVPDKDDSKLPDYALTKREVEVLTLLATDKPMADIATGLYISSNTLKATVRRLYRKLGVNSRADAIEILRRDGRF
jgi:DNA-binding CsgD family transcriptional regulator